MADKSYRIHLRQGEFELDIEGDRSFVESYIEAFLSEEVEDRVLSEGRSPGETSSGPPRKDVASRRAVPEVDRASLIARTSKARPASNKERYFQYMLHWDGAGVREVSDAHMHECFKAEGRAVPRTGRQNFSNLRKEGLVENGSKRGFWKLTATGREKAGFSPAIGKNSGRPARKALRARRSKRKAA